MRATLKGMNLLPVRRFFLSLKRYRKIRSEIKQKFISMCFSLEVHKFSSANVVTKNICEDTQKMPQSRSTASRRREARRGTYNDQINFTYEIIERTSKDKLNRGTNFERSVAKLQAGGRRLTPVFFFCRAKPHP